MDKVKLTEIAKVMDSAVISDIEISEISIDSRNITPGCLFFAIIGENFDGHDFVRSALDMGAAAAVCSRPIEGLDKPVIMVKDTHLALIKLAAYNRAQFDIPVVGLTGSVGKTTTKNMIAAVLGTQYNTLATEGNLNNDIGVPRMCLRLNSQNDAAVLEMGMSGFGEISLLTRIVQPTIGLITNIGVSHIEKLGSREGILRAKLEILDGMKPSAPLVLNGDDDMLVRGRNALSRDVILYGINNPDVDCRATDIVQTMDGISFKLTYKGRTHDIQLPVIGMHNVYNAMAAFVCGVLADVPARLCVEGLRNYVPDAHRQKIVRKGDLTFIEDCYNASPDSISASLRVMKDMECTGRRVAVLGDMLELGDYSRKAHHECGEYVAANDVDILLAYGSNAIYYIEGAGAAVKSRLYDDKNALAEDLADMLRPGDVVLFKASRGMKLEDVIVRMYELLGVGE